MKKYTLFIFVLFTLNFNTTNAANCAPGDLFSSVTGQACGKIVSTPTTSSASLSCPKFGIGAKGQAVKIFQTQLNAQGANLKADGFFGPLTKAMAERYCKNPNSTPTLLTPATPTPSTSSTLNCSTLKQTQQPYFNICKDNDLENVCFNKAGFYQGCFNNANNGCTMNNVNAATNILCAVGATMPRNIVPPTPTPVPTPVVSGAVIDWSKVSGRLQWGVNFEGFIGANKEQVFQIYLPESVNGLSAGTLAGPQMNSRIDVLLKDGGESCDKPLPTGADLEMIRKKWLEKNPQYQQYEMNLAMINIDGKNKVGEGDGYFYDFWKGGTYGSRITANNTVNFHKGCYWLLVYNKYEGAKDTEYPMNGLTAIGNGNGGGFGGIKEQSFGEIWPSCHKQGDTNYRNCVALDPSSSSPYMMHLNVPNYGESVNHNLIQLTWSVDDNYVSCQASGYDWSGIKARSGSVLVLPPLITRTPNTVAGSDVIDKGRGTPYMLSCLGKDGINRQRTQYLYNFANVVH
ncbi:MAG: hypothetical protein WC694_03040 [Candidatus Paceibacterota bacterium]|jgi:hypothetical protein